MISKFFIFWELKKIINYSSTLDKDSKIKKSEKCAMKKCSKIRYFFKYQHLSWNFLTYTCHGNIAGFQTVSLIFFSPSSNTSMSLSSPPSPPSSPPLMNLIPQPPVQRNAPGPSPPPVRLLLLLQHIFAPSRELLPQWSHLQLAALMHSSCFQIQPLILILFLFSFFFLSSVVPVDTLTCGRPIMTGFDLFRSWRSLNATLWRRLSS